MKIFRTVGIPDVATLINASLGLSAIFAAHEGYFSLAFVLILMAAVADGVDGYLARMNCSSPLGEYLDSLADVISFGVAPACVVYFLYCGELCIPAALIAVIYLSGGILRLARFSTKQKSIPDFEGLPITASAVVISSYMLLFPRYVYPYFLFSMMLLLAYLMISDHPYPKLRGTRALAFVTVLFSATIVSYLLPEIFLHVFSTMLFLSLMLYLESPIMKIPRQYYEE
ncbi:CDP-diacylglycerol--serine O-phosphatidyltransferase [Methanohalophilus levihalophilus]|uniref:archaetidylserine synthase n=1 Tax=Methanohalophilus levihalophilus TaxID=1431282 RepID=UPI001AE2D3EB|nr:archaetidylserine synthase [Methanohalophilus levihalophilus]MBP2030272.1 CDP-diacylglycerol--serine O-phosphatidyltransferase [Methanohalophilus levihalophilus]